MQNKNMTTILNDMRNIVEKDMLLPQSSLFAKQLMDQIKKLLNHGLSFKKVFDYIPLPEKWFLSKQFFLCPKNLGR